MDPYVFSLSLGAAGLGVMAATGLAASHGAHAGHAPHAGHGHAHAGHASDVSLPGTHGAAHTGAHHVGHAHAGQAHHGVARGDTGGGGGVRAASRLWTLLSPRVLFSVLVGGGATGLLLRDVLGLHGWIVALAAVIGGVLFEAALVRPLWNFAFRFASAPALTLESCLMDEARAVSGFDRNGQGLIAVEMDGQLVQVLGTLRAEDRDAGVRVRAGDRVRIEEVNAKRNTCVVSYEGPTSSSSSS